MSSATLHQGWSTVCVTARQPEPSTHLTSVVNVQTGIEDHVRTLTPDPWHLELALATRLKGQRSNEAPVKTQSDLGEREHSGTDKCVCRHSKQSTDDKQQFR